MLTDTLLRAVIRFEDEHEDALTHNLLRLRMELNHSGVDEQLMLFIATTAERAQRVATYDEVLKHFTAAANEGNGVAQAVAGRLKTLDAAEPFLTGVAFHQALEAHKEWLLTLGLGDLLQSTVQILTTGMTTSERGPDGKYGPVTRRGPQEALVHLSRGTAALRTSVRQGYTDGDIRDGTEALRQYIDRRARRGSGVLLGINAIDKVHGGLQPGELALVMGYPGHMKTTLVLNTIYHVAVMQKLNVAIVSLETPADELRAILFIMHASHPRFAGRGVVLDHDKVKNKLLDPTEQLFFDMVCEDFATNPEYGRILFKEPSAAVTMDEIHAWAELRDHQTPLSLLAIDYLGLVDPDEKVFDRQQAGSGLNRVIRQTKLMAMSFGGRGIPVISPHQANRDGFADAEKNGGRYKLSALANANEAERSADVVYYTYLDDALRATNELTLGNLKNRSGRLFTDQIRVFADPTSRLIRDTSPYDRATGLTPLE